MVQGCYFCGTRVCTARDKFSTAEIDNQARLICHNCTGKLEKIKPGMVVYKLRRRNQKE
jgi:hypothetical protein